jgi:hypothetical protein
MSDNYDPRNEYSVYQFFEDGTSERVCSFVSAEEAARAVEHYTTSLGVKMGWVKRVLITDALDCICYEWLWDKGVVFPTKEFFESLNGNRKKVN